VGAVPPVAAPVVAVVAGSAGSFSARFGFRAVGKVGLLLALAALYLAIFRLREPAYSLAGRRKAT